MRDITQDEANRLTALAEEHGFTNDEGEVALGRFTVERTDLSNKDVTITIRTLTPVVAGLYTEALEKKEPPVRFERNSEGELIVPGRCGSTFSRERARNWSKRRGA